MFGRLLMLSHKLAHEFPKKLCPVLITRFSCPRELIFKDVIDLEPKGCFAHGCPSIFKNLKNVSTALS
ncbi:hypothetical protein Thiosp_03980 [Thiorhodovibrio litoralis]|nr:hypothetical protein Thiosp_03980 [Thiorhodovibrio litoralis]